MSVREIEAKSILRKQKRIDSWFVSRYGLNLYRGCFHNCAYCDGRAEKYRVNGIFGQDLEVKVNALALLRQALLPSKRKKPLHPSFIFLGGGVNDAYQPIESRYRLARGALEIFLETNWPVQILTKSTLVLNDLDIILRIHEQKRALVNFSFSTIDDDLASLFEPGVPSPTKRLEAMRTIKSKGIPTAMFLMPVLPFITDTTEQLTMSIQAATDVGADYIIFGGLTLKPGRQRAFYYSILEKLKPDLLPAYERIYGHNPTGAGNESITHELHRRFHRIVKNKKLPVRMPLEYYSDILDSKDRLIVILEQIDYMLKLRNVKSSFGYAAYQLLSVEDLHPGIAQLNTDKWVKQVAEEILVTGRSRLYDKLLIE